MPNLIVIAGCNGSGKSTFSQSLLPDGLNSFDFDKIFLEYYHNLSDSELREEMARNLASDDFKKSIELAIKTKSDFCYETNLDVNPLYWPRYFKSKGYVVSIVFFCLSSQDIARQRVEERTEFKGHYVDNKTIDYKWREGYKNLNSYFNFFDNLLILDNSRHKKIYTNILQMENGSIELLSESVPAYFKHRLPNIYELL